MRVKSYGSGSFRDVGYFAAKSVAMNAWYICADSACWDRAICAYL